MRQYEKDIEIVDAILNSIENGGIESSLNLYEHMNNPAFLPGAIFQHIHEVLSHEPEAAQKWRAYLDSLGVANEAEVLYTSFSKESTHDFSGIFDFFRHEGNGAVRIGNVIELVTISDQMTSLVYSSLPDDKHTAVHLLVSFPSNVNENFYLILKGRDTGEAFRFSNSYIASCEDGFTLNINLRIPKLISIISDSKYVSVYINGVLYRRKLCSKPFFPEEISLQLVGSRGADLSGVVHGIEVWGAKKDFAGFSGMEDQLIKVRINHLIDNNLVSELHRLIKGIEDLDFNGLNEKILEVLSAELNNKGYKDWIFDELLSKISPELASNWLKINNDRIPKPSLSVEDLAVEFYKIPSKRFSVKSLFTNNLQKFDVLQGINIKLFPGDILGIIGANGAGKSTLLKTIAGLVPIKQGRILLNGWHLLVSPGLGVRNELTGRENIYLAGSFMGMGKKEIDDLFDGIVEFSELEDAIDKPFKFYSDGMKSRLIFSLATSVAPEILMLDELLSAGDIKFQKKAAARMDELIDRAKVVVVVTHSIGFVEQKCNKALLISKGRQIVYGDPKIAISYYLNELHLLPEECLRDEPGNLSLSQQLYQQQSTMASAGGR